MAFESLCKVDDCIGFSYKFTTFVCKRYLEAIMEYTQQLLSKLKRRRGK